MQKANQLYRIKTRKNFIYLSKDKSFKQKQINNIYSSEHSPLPSDIDGIKILVEIIKHPEYSFDELTEKLKTYGITCSSASIELFLQHHDNEITSHIYDFLGGLFFSEFLIGFPAILLIKLNLPLSMF